MARVNYPYRELSFPRFLPFGYPPGRSAPLDGDARPPMLLEKVNEVEARRADETVSDAVGDKAGRNRQKRETTL